MLNKSSECEYLRLLERILLFGEKREGRNGVTRGVFGAQMRFPLGEGFPLLTTKRVHFKSVKVELLWFLQGDTNIDYLHKYGVSIWDEWADEFGDLGPVYGAQWRSWPAPDGRKIDQLKNVVQDIKENPYSRRHVVSAWNPAEIENMALPPCHTLFQFFVSADNKLSCQLYQRSADMFLGVPFNIASYALLTVLVAKECGLGVGDFVHTIGDAHLYENHVEQAKEQLSRTPRPLPGLFIRGKDLFSYKPDDIALTEYDPYPRIKAPVSV